MKMKNINKLNKSILLIQEVMDELGLLDLTTVVGIE